MADAGIDGNARAELTCTADLGAGGAVDRRLRHSTGEVETAIVQINPQRPDLVTVPCRENLPALPQVIAGANPPEIERRVESFFHSVASIFEPGSTGASPFTRNLHIAAMSWPLSNSVAGLGRRTVRSYYTAYFQQLRERVNSAVRVPFREVQLNGEEPRLNHCHRNVDCGSRTTPKPVRGWLFWPPNDAGQSKFMAHSRVCSPGERF